LNRSILDGTQREKPGRISCVWGKSPALPADIRSAPAAPEEFTAFESEFGPIPPSYRWYLENCGGGVAGSEWLDDIRQLAATHRKFRKESAIKSGWTMRDVFVIGWEGAGNPFGISTPTGR
jgi:hypothetical protein